MNMKTKITYLLSALGMSAATALTMSACRDYDVFEEEVVKEIASAKEFNQHFIEMFGEPAENHKWGMKLLEPTDFSFGSEMTRASENNVNVNRNQWCERDNNGYKDQPYVLAKTIKVPGWPNFDGYYYGNNGSSTFGGVYTHDKIFKQDYNIQPCGDVTDYEINYVSTWFRTHKNPVSEPLHLTDFFVQNISQDNDQLKYENAIDLGGTTMQQGLPGYPKSNQTGLDGYPRSEWWNGDNANYVNDVVEANTNTKKSNVDSHIKVTHQEGHLNSNERLNYSTDFLHFKSMDGNSFTETGFAPNDGWTHINNFNYGNSNFDPENVTDKGFREIKYVHSSGTEDFACRSSMANQDEWIHDWVLVHLVWDEVGADGQSHKREGYYLGFDFSGHTNDTKIERDGFYSNWIIKISPAFLTMTPNKTARVMCEDLGGSFDFDYNDVVFDVAYDGSKNEAIICLQASGGTLPIVVGGASDTKYEAHYMLGQSTDTPVNVDAPNGARHEVAIYRISATDYLTDGQLDFNKIPVLVKYKDSNSWSAVSDAQNIGVSPGMSESEFGDHHASIQEGKKTPRKFATAIGVNWMKELKCIRDGYQKFIEWVKNPDYKYEVDVTDGGAAGATGQKQTLYWYDDITGSEIIYKGPKDPVIQSSDPSVNLVQWQSLATIKANPAINSTAWDMAVDYITIANYIGSNSIIGQLADKNTNDPITFAYITKAPADNGKEYVHGMIFPIWIIDQKPYWVKQDGTKTEITSTILQNKASYRTATWQSNFVRSGIGGQTLPSVNKGQGVDDDGNYTFVTKYGYTKADLYVTPEGESDPRYCDYVAFYVWEDVVDNPYLTAFHDDQLGVMNTAGPVKKYECYVIF